jgi:hypothetical protein
VADTSGPRVDDAANLPSGTAAAMPQRPTVAALESFMRGAGDFELQASPLHSEDRERRLGSAGEPAARNATGTN